MKKVPLGEYDDNYSLKILSYVDGIIQGPYCFANDLPDYEHLWDLNFLKEHGFNLAKPGIFYFPYLDFTTDKSIMDVARHIEKMIYLMNEAQKRKEQDSMCIQHE